MDHAITLRRTVSLPHGYTVTFRWSSNGMEIAWAPCIPHIQSPRQRRRFLDDYDAARDHFMLEVATALNETIAVATLEGDVTIICPANKH